jgi:hypothetical protein
MSDAIGDCTEKQMIDKLLARSSWQKQQQQWSVSMERDVTEWFTLPWKSGPCAAGLATELIYLLLPPQPRVTHVANSGGPYRGTVQAMKENVVEDPDARDAILHVIKFLEAYRDGSIEDWDLAGFDGPDHRSRIYHAAQHFGRYAKVAAWIVFDENREQKSARLDRWYFTGLACQQAIHIVQKWAANSTASGYAFNHFLEQIARSAVEIDMDRVPRIVTRWRYKDALDGIPSDEARRVAFESAWDLGQHEYAYQLAGRQ